jgi:recombination protein RecT
MARNPKLQEATLDSFVRCVLEAAELGQAVDGKLAHAVPFNNKVKDADGVERWRVECTFIADYKGLIAVARRSGIIRDIHADVVSDNDHFIAERQGGTDLLIHKRDLKRPRGNVYAAYAIVTRPDGTWRYELMDLEELHAVRARSKAFTASKPSGPWVTDPKEMYCKTVIRRTLKLYTEDAALKRALDKDDDIDAELEEPRATAFTPTTWPSAAASAPTSAPPGPATAGNQFDGDDFDGQDPPAGNLGRKVKRDSRPGDPQMDADVA